MNLPMNWGGRTRTYNFLINSQPEPPTARVRLVSVEGKDRRQSTSTEPQKHVSGPLVPGQVPGQFRVSGGLSR